MSRSRSIFPSVPALLLGLALLASAGSVTDAATAMGLLGEREAATFCPDPVGVATLQWLSESADRNGGKRLDQPVRPAFCLLKVRPVATTAARQIYSSDVDSTPQRAARLYRLTDLPPPQA